ncbi:MAG: hypothetical protein CMJ78_10395 [Planctomycetaceae bacterium]|nr:hypothetical protein [Planctomycetaceae bacterium]
MSEVAQDITEFTENPLSPLQREQLVSAIKSAQKMRGAASMAMFNIVACALFAFVSLASVILGPTGFVMGLGLGTVAIVELLGRMKLKRLDDKGPKLLAWNQFGFMLLLVGYSIWMLYSRLTGPNPMQGISLDAEFGDLSSVMPSMESLYILGNIIVFGGLLLLSIVFQGLNALFYRKCAKQMAGFVNTTPEWVMDLLKSGKLI